MGQAGWEEVGQDGGQKAGTGGHLTAGGQRVAADSDQDAKAGQHCSRAWPQYLHNLYFIIITLFRKCRHYCAVDANWKKLDCL